MKAEDINDSRLIVWYLIYKNLFVVSRDVEDKINDMYLIFPPVKKNEIINLYDVRTRVASDPVLLIEDVKDTRY